MRATGAVSFYDAHHKLLTQRVSETLATRIDPLIIEDTNNDHETTRRSVRYVRIPASITHRIRYTDLKKNAPDVYARLVTVKPAPYPLTLRFGKAASFGKVSREWEELRDEGWATEELRPTNNAISVTNLGASAYASELLRIRQTRKSFKDSLAQLRGELANELHRLGSPNRVPGIGDGEITTRPSSQHHECDTALLLADPVGQKYIQEVMKAGYHVVKFTTLRTDKDVDTEDPDNDEEWAE